MSVVVGLVVVVLYCLGAWRLWLLHRSVASIRATVADVPEMVEDDLNQFWSDLNVLHAEHTNAVEVRLRRAEAAAAQAVRETGLVSRHVSWMGPWVRHWASQHEAAEAHEQVGHDHL